MKIFNNKNFVILEKSLDALSKNHDAISNNISNVDTPGYKRQYVSFKNELANLLENRNDLAVTNDKHISINSRNLTSFEGKVRTEENTSIRNDENNVDIDAEMSMLAKNTLEYQALVQRISSKFKGLQTVIRQGGR
ncbi:flagellar basal-body rod protein FlgB [Orenia metallireducens]|jgi:flagellar basal-body rod protein FlgB|uniref:Flagellar basal body rod protein FlgB n=1 Tax=Orenia metallireducens TaxID=1413210 RepID=A0A1C0A9Y8_9FIRM|nr:flagellar basal body rod protein FlgB [Orenia metallireducens]OCL27079.1 flagellar basal-body rod protein FlgB [Orenia metallireducens]